MLLSPNYYLKRRSGCGANREENIGGNQTPWLNGCAIGSIVDQVAAGGLDKAAAKLITTGLCQVTRDLTDC